jgi:hypothetical protein
LTAATEISRTLVRPAVAAVRDRRSGFIRGTCHA